MIASINSSISNAIRAANTAQKQLVTAQSQLATGKKVSSVKDDGANYAISKSLEAQKVNETVRIEFTAARLEAGAKITEVIEEAYSTSLHKLKEIALSAKSYSIGSTQRQALQQDWLRTIESANLGSVTNPVNSGWSLSSADSVNVDIPWSNFPSGDSIYHHLVNATVGLNLYTFDLVNATATDFTNLDTTLNTHQMGLEAPWNNVTGLMENIADRLRKNSQNNLDRLDSALSSITDIDVEKTSYNLEKAQNRQSQAISAISNAISHYSAVSNSLLNNIMNTQRSIRA